MAPKKAPSKREHDPRAGTSSHGSSKLGTNETNNEEFPLGDHDDESVGVNEGAVDSVWTRPSIFHLLSEGTNEAASTPYAQVTDKPSLKPSAQEKEANEHAAAREESERQHLEHIKQIRDRALEQKARLEATERAAKQSQPSQASPPKTWRPGESRFGAMSDEAKALYEATEQAARGEAIHRGIFEDEQARLEVERARRADSFARPQHWPEHLSLLSYLYDNARSRTEWDAFENEDLVKFIHDPDERNLVASLGMGMIAWTVNQFLEEGNITPGDVCNMGTDLTQPLLKLALFKLSKTAKRRVGTSVHSASSMDVPMPPPTYHFTMPKAEAPTVHVTEKYYAPKAFSTPLSSEEVKKMRIDMNRYAYTKTIDNFLNSIPVLHPAITVVTDIDLTRLMSFHTRYAANDKTLTSQEKDICEADTYLARITSQCLSGDASRIKAFNTELKQKLKSSPITATSGRSLLVFLNDFQKAKVPEEFKEDRLYFERQQYLVAGQSRDAMAAALHTLTIEHGRFMQHDTGALAVQRAIIERFERVAASPSAIALHGALTHALLEHDTLGTASARLDLKTLCRLIAATGTTPAPELKEALQVESYRCNSSTQSTRRAVRW